VPQLYDKIGAGYNAHRRPDPRIGAAILNALSAARSVVNVGAGAGAYEPTDRPVVAVEPSAAMIRQRPLPARSSSEPPPPTFRSATAPSTQPWPSSLSTTGRIARGVWPSCGAWPGTAW